jgi:hypothetical protein
MSSIDATASDSTRSAEEVPSDPATTVTPETGTEERGGSTAEPLGGWSESEQTPETAGSADRGIHEGDIPEQRDTATDEGATLIAPERAESYNRRWDDIKGKFVDEPRGAVQGANALVGEVLDELEELLRRRRSDLEHGLDHEQASTEDLRQALGRYRSFFDRLLSF